MAIRRFILVVPFVFAGAAASEVGGAATCEAPEHKCEVTTTTGISLVQRRAQRSTTHLAVSRDSRQDEDEDEDKDEPAEAVLASAAEAAVAPAEAVVAPAGGAAGTSTGFNLLSICVVSLACYMIWRDFLSNRLDDSAGVELSPEVLDVLIVGAGFGGAYTAYQIKTQFPNKKVAIFEKSERIGGRLMSVRGDAAHGVLSTVKQELGGMRIFPSKMEKVAEMVKAAGCHLVPVSLNDEHNLFYYKGIRYEKGSFKMPTGRTCGQMSDACLKKWLQAHPKDKGRDCYLSEELRSKSLSELFLKYGATPEEVEAHNCFGGYDLNQDDVTASLYVKDGELYGAALSKDQKYVHEGYMTVVEQLVLASKAMVHMKRKVIGITKDEASGLVHVTASSNNGHSKVHKAKQVLVSLPFDQMSELVETFDISADRKLALTAVTILPLFKCFLEWDEEKIWWKKLGFACGKSTTDLDLRQVHYYDSVDLLIYNSGPYAVKWNYRFQEDPAKAARTAFDMLKELHNMPDMPEPIWERTHFKFWVDGSHKWKVGSDIYDSMKTICHGKEDNSNIYLCGDAFSSYQGWVCGAIETADICLEQMRKKLVK